MIGPFSAFHTRACLAVAAARPFVFPLVSSTVPVLTVWRVQLKRQKMMKRLASYEPFNKMADAVLYGGIVALTFGSTLNCQFLVVEPPTQL